MLPVDRARAEVPVMVSPGDETAAGAERHARLRASAVDREHARLRASAVDREQVIEALKAAFVQDRITKDELDQRVGKVLASRTYDDLDILTADIPAGLPRAQLAEPARGSDGGKKLIRRASAGSGGTFFVAAAAASLPHFDVLTALFFGSVAGMFVGGLLATLLTLIKWVLDRSSGRQTSQGPSPGAGDNAARHPAPASPAAQPRQIGHRKRPGAEAARPRSPIGKPAATAAA
ncbi:MAG: DUF1707 SHOCT-like domain-containing protein [Streptosporangiaceae bacterium]